MRSECLSNLNILHVIYDNISYTSAWRVCGNNNAPDAFRLEKLAETTVAASDFINVYRINTTRSLFKVNIQRA